uniref:Uncharacterized protein n=1 Tax=Romanomermis culicivorax TaxID=13658 RepID=A0A915K8B4_ROMCU
MKRETCFTPPLSAIFSPKLTVMNRQDSQAMENSSGIIKNLNSKDINRIDNQILRLKIKV